MFIIFISLLAMATGTGLVYYSYNMPEKESLSFLGNAYRGQSFFFMGVLAVIIGLVIGVEALSNLIP